MLMWSLGTIQPDQRSGVHLATERGKGHKWQVRVHLAGDNYGVKKLSVT